MWRRRMGIKGARARAAIAPRNHEASRGRASGSNGGGRKARLEGMADGVARERIIDGAEAGGAGPRGRAGRPGEAGRVLRFALVGVATAAIYALLFLLARTAGVAPWLASTAAFAVAVAFQYAAHAAFTFRRPLRRPDQIARFAATVGLGWATATAVTAAIGPALGLAEAVSVGIAVTLLPVLNFVLFRLWVYRGPQESAGASRRTGTPR